MVFRSNSHDSNPKYRWRFCLLVFGATAPQWARASSFTRFLYHTQRRNTFVRTHMDEWSACRRDLYLTTHNTHSRQISMTPVGCLTHNLSRRVAAEPRLRPLGHRDTGGGRDFNNDFRNFNYKFWLQVHKHYNKLCRPACKLQIIFRRVRKIAGSDY